MLFAEYVAIDVVQGVTDLCVANHLLCYVIGDVHIRIRLQSIEEVC